MKVFHFIAILSTFLIISVSTLPLPAPLSLSEAVIMAGTTAGLVTPIALGALKWRWKRKLIDKTFDRVGQWQLEKFAIEKQKYKEGMWEPSWKERGGKEEKERGDR